MEGWHNQLNRKTRSGKLVMYQLAPLVHREALFVDIQSVLVHEHQQKQYQQLTYGSMQVACMITGVVTPLETEQRHSC